MFKRVFKFFGEVIKIIVISLLIVLPIRHFLVQPFFVRGSSMEPTFSSQEYLLVDEISYRFRSPQRGEVVIFHFPRDPKQYYIKRIIGLPGEKIVISDGKVTVYSKDFPKGKTLDESDYLPPGHLTPGTFETILEQGQYFVSGDNRQASFDSRRWGALDREYIVGRVWLRIWPFNKVEAFTSPQYSF